MKPGNAVLELNKYSNNDPYHEGFEDDFEEPGSSEQFIIAESHFNSGVQEENSGRLINLQGEYKRISKMMREEGRTYPNGALPYVSVAGAVTIVALTAFIICLSFSVYYQRESSACSPLESRHCQNLSLKLTMITLGWTSMLLTTVIAALKLSGFLSHYKQIKESNSPEYIAYFIASLICDTPGEFYYKWRDHLPGYVDAKVLPEEISKKLCELIDRYETFPQEIVTDDLQEVYVIENDEESNRFSDEWFNLQKKVKSIFESS